MSTPVFPTNPQDGEEFTALENGVTYVYDASSNSWSVGELLGDAQLLPDIKPSLDLDFANTKSLDPRIDFSRGSSGTYYGGQTFAKAEENLLKYSQEFDNGVWGKVNTSVTADSGTSPDGSQTADTINFNGNGTDSVIFGTDFDIESSKTYAISVFVKYIDQQWIQIHGSSTRWNDYRANFDVQNGTVGDVSGYQSSQIIDVGNGWYRLSVIGSPDSSGTTAAPMAISGVDNSSSVRAESLSASNTSAFIWGAQFEERSQVTAYTPTTDQPITNYIPVLKTAALNEPRFDHDPVTGESKGLLIEEQRTNLLTYSEDFANSYWDIAGDGTVSTNNIVSPDGFVNGTKIKSQSTGTTGINNISAFSASSGNFYTASIFVKSGNRTEFNINILDDLYTTGAAATYDLVNLTAQDGGTSEEDFEFVEATLQDVGNDWYRVSFTVKANYSGTSRIDFRYSADAPDEFLYFWGAQIEEGSFPTSYIKTEGSQVTRVADSVGPVVLRDVGISVNDFTIFTEYYDFFGDNYDSVIGLGDSDGGDNNNYFGINKRSSRFGSISRDVGLVETLFISFPQDSFKAALSVNNDESSVFSTQGDLKMFNYTIHPASAGVDRHFISSRAGTYLRAPASLIIKRLTYYPKRLPNTVLQRLTQE